MSDYRCHALRAITLCLAALPLLPGNAFAQRLVTLSPGLAELVYAAGAGDQLVGVVEYSDFPEPVRRLPRIGDAFRVDYEALSQLQPDIVLSWGSGTPRPIVERLQQLGFTVVEFEPRRLADIAAELERIGELAGTPAHAKHAAAAWRRQLGQLRAQYADRQPLRVFYQISANPWFTVSGEHVISEVIALCGGENVFADTPGIAPSVSLEAILRARPQVIIAGAQDATWQAVWQPWAELPAVANGALYQVDPDLLTRGTPRLLDGARQVCAALDAARAQLNKAGF